MIEPAKTKEELIRGYADLVTFIVRSFEDYPPLTPEEQARFIQAALTQARAIKNSKPFHESELIDALHKWTEFHNAGKLSDINGGGTEDVEVQTMLSPARKPVMYINVNGVTVLRISNFKTHRYKDGLKKRK
jgi:hypothetical protein